MCDKSLLNLTISKMESMADGLNSEKGWVKFDETDSARSNDSPAVLDTQLSEQVSIESTSSIKRTSPSKMSHSKSEPLNGVALSNSLKREATSVDLTPLNAAQLQNIPLDSSSNNQSSRPVIRQGFANGDVIVSVLPQNSALPWIMPARFRPELVPEELMAQGLTLTVEEYVHVMTQLVNDHRFSLYNICYKRILMVWISFAFVILLCILFLNLPQYGLFGAGILWLLVNAGAIFLCMWIKIKLNKNLELCVARLNSQLLKHKILMGIDDRGKLSCHKINICFIYYDSEPCVKRLEEVIGRTQETTQASNDAIDQHFDYEDPQIVITGSTNVTVTQKQERPSNLLSHYSQRWAKEFLRKRLDWAFDASARLAGLSPPIAPRHVNTARCLCQYIEEHTAAKSAMKAREGNLCCCACLSDFCRDFDF